MRISKEKKDRIKEQILSFLLYIYPKSKFTAEIAREIARDEEFTKKLLNELRKKGFVIDIKKNPHGERYSRRRRWRASKKAYQNYE